MTERMKTFIYCAITAIVTTIVVSAGQPQAVQAQTSTIPESLTITHIIKFGTGKPREGGMVGDVMKRGDDQLRTLIIKKQ